MTAIAPIETRYAGHRFRSRLEARWAVFFDNIGLKWEYEPQGYLVGEQRRPYLPDFYLTDLGWWVEVKGSGEQLDISLLIDAVHPRFGLGRPDAFYMTNLLILGGIPKTEMPHGHFAIQRSCAIGTPSMGKPIIGAGCGGDCEFTATRFGLRCFYPIPRSMPKVDKAALDAIRGRGANLHAVSRTSAEIPGGDPTEALPLIGHKPLFELEHAYQLARTARFEHGETPQSNAQAEAS